MVQACHLLRLYAQVQPVRNTRLIFGSSLVGIIGYGDKYLVFHRRIPQGFVNKMHYLCTAQVTLLDRIGSLVEISRKL